MRRERVEPQNERAQRVWLQTDTGPSPAFAECAYADWRMSDGARRIRGDIMRTQSGVRPEIELLAEGRQHLQSCLDNLDRLMALPELKDSRGPQDSIGALLDALLEILCLEFVLVRSNDSSGRPAYEMVRTAEKLHLFAGPRQIAEALDATLGSSFSNWPPSARVLICDLEIAVASARLGFESELGVVVAGSRNLQFPETTDNLLLGIAAQQATIRLQQARLLSEQARAAELDDRVAQRTREVAVVSKKLKKEVAERRRVEANLREVQREPQLILDTIPGLVAVLAQSGEPELLNQRMIDYFGKGLEEIKRWNTNDVFYPDDLARALQIFKQALASGNPYELEARLRRFDGAYRWFQLRGLPLSGTSGRIARWYVLVTDIDDLKRAQEALRASESKLRVIINTIPALAWSANPDRTYGFFNLHYLEFLGMSEEQASKNWADAIHPDDYDGLISDWRRIAASGKVGEAQARLRRRDGEYRWCLFRASPLRDQQGNIVQWYGVNTDIEDSKRAAEQVLRAYGHLSEAQRLSQTGSFTADLHRDLHTWSDEFYRICDFEPGSKVNIQRLGEIVHPEDMRLYQGAMQRALAGGESRFEFRIVTSGGVMKHLRGAAHRVEQTTGPVFVGAIHDVTASKVAEDALNQARYELAYVSRLATLSTLTACIAHEVSQPLSGVVTNAGTCLRLLDAATPDIAGARETAERAIRDGNRAAAVIKRLRDLFSKKEFTLEPINLNEATQEVITLLTSELRRYGVILQLDLDEDLPGVTGDRMQLQQVILNLLRNAWEAMAGVDDRPRRLVIRTAQEGKDHVRMTVRDAGVGLDAGSGDKKLFDPFYTTKSAGMGIGLSVSRSIIERHSGRLWSEPNDGPGATFAFLIPCIPQ
jgi:PAS domain S-box-containing protein